ncbi:MAG: DEAD/DEAH box helicase, partial [bacterium]
VPTRELAIQVDESLRKIGRPLGIRTAVLIGGASMSNQIQSIKRNPHIIIATPGRLNDHLERKTISLNAVKILVLDEADRMLDMGFMPQIERVLQHVPKEKQVMLFSATIPDKIVSIATRYMKMPVSVEIARSGTIADKVTQELFIINKEDKPKLLEKLLYQYRGTVLIFSRTRRGAARINRGLKSLGHSSAEIHSDRSLAQRREALEGFKTGKYRILVATDIAARGIDVKGIELVLNYDLPDDSENYVHRIGRTGRAKHEGRAISFATPDQRGEVKCIENVMRTALPVVQHPEVATSTFYEPPKTRRPFAKSRSRFPRRGRR